MADLKKKSPDPALRNGPGLGCREGNVRGGRQNIGTRGQSHDGAGAGLTRRRGALRREHDENMVRFDFRESERHAIQKAIAARDLGDGRKNNGGDRRSEAAVSNSQEIVSLKKDHNATSTLAKAATMAGFSNRETARQVGVVVEAARSMPEVVTTPPPSSPNSSKLTRTSAAPS